MVGDGAYGTLLAPRLLGGEVVDELCVREPDAVIDAHRSYLEAGAGCIQSNSFLAWRFRERRRRDIYAAALECARSAAAASAGSRGEPVRVRATVGPAGREPRAFYRDIEQLLDAGVDELLCETVTEAPIAAAFLRAWYEVVAGARARATLSFSVSPSRGARSWQWIGKLAVPAGVAVGLNCCEGPAGLRAPLELLADTPAGERGMRVGPSAGLPVMRTGQPPMYPLSPDEWADAVAALVDGLSVDVVDGCCGTTPGFITGLRAALA